MCRAKIDAPPASNTSTTKSPLASAAEENDEETDEASANPMLSRHFCEESDHSRDGAMERALMWVVGVAAVDGIRV